MKKTLAILIILAATSCVTRHDFLPTYAEWEQRLNAKPKTGFAWTQDDMVLDRALGAQAHLHEPFLAVQLKANPYVIKILDSSPILCRKYAVAPVGTNAFVVEARQGMWLKALSKEASPQSVAP